MSNSDISLYLTDYNKKLLDSLKSGDTFKIAGKVFSTSTSGNLASALKNNKYDEPVNFPWLDELYAVTEHIMAIASNPRTHVRFDKEIRLAEQAVKVDGQDMRMTTKTSKLWRLKDEDYKPEKVYTTVYEADFAIYENRFLLNLVNKINNLLNHTIRTLSDRTKLISKQYINNLVSISSIDEVNDIGNLGKITYPKTVSDENLLLTTNDAPFLSAWKTLIKAKNRINNFYSTEFYRYLKDQKPLSDSDVHITNILADDLSYAPCYNFYLKLLNMINAEDIKEDRVIDPDEYHNYVMTNIFSALLEQGFRLDKGDLGNLNIENKLIKTDNYKVVKDDMSCYITTNNNEHIDIHFVLNYKKNLFSSNNPLFKGKRESLVSIDLVHSRSHEFLNNEELAVYFRKMINQRLKKDYTNAFVVTPIDGMQKDDIIICSPFAYKIDANIANMIKSCLVFAEGDTSLYNKICPVCGSYVDGEQENGNCYCSNCGSVYSLMSQGKEENKVELIWIKRIKNPD